MRYFHMHIHIADLQAHAPIAVDLCRYASQTEYEQSSQTLTLQRTMGQSSVRHNLWKTTELDGTNDTTVNILWHH